MPGRYLIILFLTAMLVAATAVAKDQRISLYDFAAPYVSSMPKFVGEGKPPRLQHEAVIAMELKVNADGAVANVSMDPSAHERMAVYIGPYVKQLQFVPATFQDNNVPAKLPMDVLLWPGEHWPTFTFPVDSLGQLNNRYLYDRCLELNDITPPRVKRFESYFVNANTDTTLRMYNYVLFGIDLDSSGVVLDRRILKSTLPVYDEQVKTAILWSEFAPATVRGRSIPSKLYLMVSFFDAVAYPTSLWPPNPDNISNPLEFLRLRSFADQAGLMTLPLPKQLPTDLYPLGPNQQVRLDTVSARIEIDSLGRCRYMGSEKTRDEIRNALRRVVTGIRFFPALDFDGRPRNYSGRVFFEFTGEASVRVRCAWLR